MSEATGTQRKKIAILGGGVGGMVTALELTDPDNPNAADYDVTVYQYGWRLGGKGASGRNMDPALNYRIEEHGLHVWFGCYDNSFRLIRKCYEELDRAPDAPLARWDDAFKPHSAGGTWDFQQGQWRAWLEAFPPNDAIPGEGDLLPLWEYFRIGAGLLHQLLFKSAHSHPSPTGIDDVHLPGRSGERAQSIASKIEDAIFKGFVWLMKHVHVLAAILRFGSGILLWITRKLLEWRWARIRDRVRGNDPRGRADRHVWLFANAMYAVLHAFHKNKVMTRGIRSQCGTDFREYLGKYGVDDGGFMMNSNWLRGIYDGMFAYVDGDNTVPPGEQFPPKAKTDAGAALICGLRQYATYKGAAVWRMQAGMGDTIFGPMYEVLKRRGVTFKLFHKVEQLRTDGESVTTIEVSRQVTIRPEQEARGGYDPMIDVKGLPCWPSTPLYDQIVEGEELRSRGIDLEDYCADWEPVENITLRRGHDFDEVVMAISIGAIPYLCGDLIDANTRWKDMVTHVLTNRTVSAQFWFKPTAYELGWKIMQRPLMSSYDITELDTWADMSYLGERENWRSPPPNPDGSPATAEEFPQQVSYFTGPMKDDPLLEMTPRGPMTDCHGLDQDRANARARELAKELLEEQIGIFFPNVYTPGENPEFRWDLLVDNRPGSHEGDARLDSQYFHANVQPSERYVLSVPGSDQYRLAPGDSGFKGLVVAGDWTDSGFNAGCVEGAVMSGRLASNAISGYPKKSDIVGYDWW
ncbi:MAG: FAD-dependent oxidoreductase [Gemmatimonadota bacterium]